MRHIVHRNGPEKQHNKNERIPAVKVGQPGKKQADRRKKGKNNRDPHHARRKLETRSE